jgi:hypothetical protein
VLSKGVSFALALSALALSALPVLAESPTPRWVPDYVEQRMCNRSDYDTVILPPIPAGQRPLCEEPPSHAAILRALPRAARGVPYVCEVSRDDLDFTVERLVDRIDPPRFYPLVGPAQLHHCHYKCTVHFTETVESRYPFPFSCAKRRSQTVYIDRDHLHLVNCTPEELQALTRDLTQYQP